MLIKLQSVDEIFDPLKLPIIVRNLVGIEVWKSATASKWTFLGNFGTRSGIEKCCNHRTSHYESPGSYLHRTLAIGVGPEPFRIAVEAIGTGR